jgi:hypothetical protein
VAHSNGSLKERLARYRQIKISVIGRKTGQTHSPEEVYERAARVELY